MASTQAGPAAWAIALLFGCTAFAFYAAYVMAISGGLLEALFKASLIKPRVFPGTQVAMREMFTGIRPVDWHANNLISFWTPIIFRQSEALNLFTTYFMLQWVASFTFIYLESLRVGNRNLAVGR